MFHLQMLRLNFLNFIQKLDLKLKSMKRMNNRFYITNLYVTFFKRVCEIISKTSEMNKKLEDGHELYIFNFKNKIFRNLKKATDSSQIEKGKYYRRVVIWRQLFKNLFRIHVCNFILFI